MISRRRILKLGTAAAAAALATPVTAATSENNCTALPPSIASLTSMKDQAKPITTEERGERQEKARRLMADNKLDAILLTEGTSLTYFSGIHWGGSERLFAVVLPVKGNVFYVCPAFEEGRAREQIAKAPGAEQADVRIWQEDGSPYQRVAQGLNDRGLSTGTLGIEETVRFVFSQGIGKASPQMKIASATPVTAGCRMIKSNHEVELMRLAAKVTLTAYEAAYHALNPGMTKPQLEEMVEAAHSRLGFSGSADAQVGEYSAFPHGSITPQVIREGAIVLMDGGGNVEGYTSDITRIFVLGKPSDKMKTVFDIVHRAQTAALKTARPGLECQAVDAAARSVLTDAGYGPDYKFFTHRVGHGMGMDVHAHGSQYDLQR
jgi:Xaa-Pro dipeptidase